MSVRVMHYARETVELLARLGDRYKTRQVPKSSAMPYRSHALPYQQSHLEATIQLCDEQLTHAG